MELIEPSNFDLTLFFFAFGELPLALAPLLSESIYRNNKLFTGFIISEPVFGHVTMNRAFTNE